MSASKSILRLIVVLLALAGNGFAQATEACETCHKDSHYTQKRKYLKVTRGDLRGTVHEKLYCKDCHYRGYDDYPHNKFAKSVSCGECHEEQKKEFENSTHFRSRMGGNLDAPNCVSCHGSHKINKPTEALRGPEAIKVCSQCHGEEARNTRFQLKADVVAGFKSSYHGQMYGLGFTGDDYATCVSCHDNHSILGKDSPQSTIAQQNIIKTCSKCHEDANANFVGYLTHYTGGDDGNATLRTVTDFMGVLLWGTMVFFGIHTLLWFLRSVVASGYAKSGGGGGEESRKFIWRFNSLSRLLHVVMVVAFLILAMTGLPLKFNDSGLAHWLANNVIGFAAAASLHRIAAIVLIAVFLVHIFDLVRRLFISRERGLFWGEKSLVPNTKDAADLFGHLAYFLYLRKSPPKFGRWTYWEKFDYLAVFWGMAAIGLSGLILMAPSYFTGFMPGWMINVAHVVHSEEALLATAFIFCIHFFHTHLRPNAFPIDDVIFTGRISVETLKEEKPLEYERLAASGALEALTAPELAPWKQAVMRIVGFGFVVVGLVLLVLIFSSL